MSEISSTWVKQLANAMLQMPLTQGQVYRYDRFERDISNSMAITGKTRDEIITFVTESLISYSDLANFILMTGRLPNKKEQIIIFKYGVDAIRVERPTLTIDQLKTFGANLCSIKTP